ncbi:MAG TPA: YihA family ribosome biogenesis GTP-binding protein [Sutterella sp.]|nr:YihA family ribosome biogenesis GTP-binding protein [Sutterella sp.]
MFLFESACFRVSAAKFADIEPSLLPEIAFVGRSNAGKSSTINTLTHKRQLAFASKTPGRTQLINFFTLSKKNQDKSLTPVAELVDLPGYGFSKADPATRASWGRLATDYLLGRQNLVGVVIVMDARRPFTVSDDWVIDLLNTRPVKLHFLLNKADQIKAADRKPTLATSLSRAESLGTHVTTQFFSSLKKEGLPELEDVLTHWIDGTEIVRESSLI